MAQAQQGQQGTLNLTPSDFDGYTVGEVVDHVLSIHKDEGDPKTGQTARQSVDEYMDMLGVWGASGDPRLIRSWIKLQRTIELSRNARQPRKNETEFWTDDEFKEGTGAFSNWATLNAWGPPTLPLMGDKSPQLNDPDGAWFSGVADALVDDEVSGVRLGRASHDLWGRTPENHIELGLDQDIVSSPVIPDIETIVRNAAILGSDIQFDEASGQRYVELANGEQVTIPSWTRPLEIGMADGSTRVLEPDGRLLKSLADAKDGGAFRSITTNLLSRIAGESQPVSVWTPYGKRYVPAFTGNPASDMELYLRPEIMRGVEGAGGDRSFFEKFGGALLQTGEFIGLTLATRRVGGLLGAGAQKLMTKLPPGAQSLAKFTGKTLGAWGKSANEGGRRSRWAVPGTNFDMAQLGEEIWYETALGLSAGEYRPKEWISNGTNEWAAEYALGFTARFGRGAARKALGSRVMPEWASEWANRYKDGAQKETLLSGLNAAYAAREQGAEKIASLVEAGMFGAVGRSMGRELAGQAFDTFFVGYSFGAWQGAQLAAAKDGRVWGDLSYGEKTDYLQGALGSMDAWAQGAAMVTAVGAGFGVATRKAFGEVANGPGVIRGVMSGEFAAEMARQLSTAEQVKGIKDWAQSISTETKKLLDQKSIQTGVTAMFDGAETDTERSAWDADELAKVRGYEGDPRTDMGASFTRAPVGLALELYRKKGGPADMKEAFTNMPTSELAALHNQLMLGMPETEGELQDTQDAHQLRQMIFTELTARAAMPEAEADNVDEFEGTERWEPLPQRYLSPEQITEAWTPALVPQVNELTKRRRDARVYTLTDQYGKGGSNAAVITETQDARGNLAWVLKVPRVDEPLPPFEHTPEGLEQAMRLGMVGMRRLVGTADELLAVGDKPQMTDRQRAAAGVGPTSNLEARIQELLEAQQRTTNTIADFQGGVQAARKPRGPKPKPGDLEAMDAAGVLTRSIIERKLALRLAADNVLNGAKRAVVAAERMARSEARTAELGDRKVRAEVRAGERRAKAGERAEKRGARRTKMLEREVMRYSKMGRNPRLGRQFLAAQYARTRDPLLRLALEEVLASADPAIAPVEQKKPKQREKAKQPEAPTKPPEAPPAAPAAPAPRLTRDRPPTAKEAEGAKRRVQRAILSAPSSAESAKPVEDRVLEAIPPEAAGSLEMLEDAVDLQQQAAAAERAAAKLPAKAKEISSQSGRERRKRAKAAEAQLSASLAEAQALGLGPGASAFSIGSEAFAPSDSPSATRLTAAIQASVAIAAGDPNQALVQRASLIAGMVTAIGLPPLSARTKQNYELIAAVAGVPVDEVAKVRRQLVDGAATLDSHINNVAAASTDWMSRPLLSAAQLARSDTREALRLIALGFDIKPRGRGSLFGGNIGKQIRNWWANEGRAQAIAALARGGSMDAVSAAVDADFEKRIATIESVAGATGMRVRDLFAALAGRISVSLGGGPNPNLETKLESMGNRTLFDVTVELSEKLSGKKFVEPVLAAPTPVTEPVEIEQKTPEVALAELGQNVEWTYRDMLTASRDLGKFTEALGFKPGSAAEGRFLRLLSQIDTTDPATSEAGLVQLLSSTLSGDGEMTQLGFALQSVPVESLLEMSNVARTLTLKAQDVIEVVAQTLDATGGSNMGLAVRDIMEAMEHRANGLELNSKLRERLRTGDARRFQAVDENGNLTPAAETMVGRMLHSALATAEAELMRRGRLTQQQAQAEVKVNPETVRLFAGLGTAADGVRAIASLVNFSTGWFQRMPVTGRNVALSEPLRDVDITSPQSYLSARRIVDAIAARDTRLRAKGAKSLAAQYVAHALKWWQNGYFYRGKRGLATKDVVATNFKFQTIRLSESGWRMAVGASVTKLTHKIASLKISTFEREALGAMLASGEITRVNNRAEFEKLPHRAKLGHLYDLGVEINEMMISLGLEMVDAGLVDPVAYKVERGRHLPRKFVEWAWSDQGPVYFADSGEFTGPTASSSEFERSGALPEKEGLRLTMDVGYVLPVSLAKATARTHVFRVLHRMRNEGLITTRSEYAAMGPLGKAQYQKLSDRGVKRDIASGESKPYVTLEERASMTPEEIEETLQRRAHTTEAQAILQTFIDDERSIRARDGGPTMTPALEELLKDLEEGYVTASMVDELAMLVNNADFGRPSTHGVAENVGRFVQEMSLQWRQLRTIQNPRHWVMQFTSNLVTNSATGKVPLGDMVTSILLGEGTYAEAADHMVEWHDAVLADDGRALSPEAEMFAKYVKDAGGNSIVSMIAHPLTALDFVGSMFTSDTGLPLGEDTSGAAALKAATVAVTRQAPGFSRAEMAINRLESHERASARAEGKRALLGMYQMHELYWKYAAYLEARKRGLEHDAAIHWSAEGTGDYSDRNPKLLRLTTNFGIAHGRLRERARKEIGKPEAKTLAETFMQLGIASPFWMYQASMVPTILGAYGGRNSAKALMGSAAMALMVRAVGEAFGGEDDDLLRAQAGKGDFFGVKPGMDGWNILARQYPDAPMPGFGGASLPGVRQTLGEFAHLINAWFQHNAHALTFGVVGSENPDSALLMRARGPTIGGQSTMLDFSSFNPGLQAIESAADMATRVRSLSAGNWSKPVGAATDYGVGFLTVATMSAMSDALNLMRGVKGRTRAELMVEVANNFAQEWTAPLGGGQFPVIFTREMQGIAGAFAWDGRSPEQVLMNIPAPNVESELGGLLSMALARTVVPMQRVGSGPAQRPPEGIGAGMARLLGIDLRTPEAGNAEDRAFDVRRSRIRDATLAFMGRAYREHLDLKTVPYDRSWSRYFAIDRDLRYVDGELDVVDSPTTEMGKWLRSTGGSADERRPWVREAVLSMREQGDRMLRLVTGGDGLVYRRDVDPSLHDRIVRAAYDQRDDPAKLLRFIHGELRRTPETAGALARVWRDSGLARAKSRMRGADLEIWTKTMEQLRDIQGAEAMPDVDWGSMLGPRLYDVAPVEAVKTIPMKSRSRLEVEYPTLFGDNR